MARALAAKDPKTSKLRLGPANWVACSLLVWRRDHQICAVFCFTALRTMSELIKGTTPYDPSTLALRTGPVRKAVPLVAITTLALPREVYMMQYASLPPHPTVLRWSLKVRYITSIYTTLEFQRVLVFHM